MAQSPIPRHDPFDSPESSAEPSPSEPVPDSEPGTGLSLAQWVRALSTHGGGPVSTELALDLVLNEIVQRGCATTGANAAAIALERDGQIVCRATTGESAPDLGSRLNIDSGLSAACVKTRDWQCCDDTEADSRVNPEVCRRLGMRSILVVPVVRNEGDLVGVIEIFSSRPNAFRDPEITALQRLSREIIESIDLAASLSAMPPPPPVVAEVTTNLEPAKEPGELRTNDQPVEVTGMEAPTPRISYGKVRESDLWTGALLLAVVVLALILGWAVGRAGWKHASTSAAAQKGQADRGSAPANESGTVPSANSGAAGGQGGTTVPVHGGAASTGSDLVVYKNGKVIFQLPSQSSGQPGSAAVPVQSGVNKSDVPAPIPVRISPQIAVGYLATRVEPEYPKTAREGHIQGPVVLDIVVDKDGVVQRLTTISGDAQLAAAATDAVKQWRFRPFFRHGQPEEFQTQITVVFRLP